MAGAGVEARMDGYRVILDALSRAAMPDMKKIAAFAAGELHDVSNTAFEDEADPATGVKWEPLKHPRRDGSVTTILRDHGMLHGSLTHEGYEDGTAVLGTNMVYGRIHQEGGDTGRGHKSHIPARPYMGIPKDFERHILNDPYILGLLGLGGTS
jgi:phage virion morphogenesis protein